MKADDLHIQSPVHSTRLPGALAVQWWADNSTQPCLNLIGEANPSGRISLASSYQNSISQVGMAGSRNARSKPPLKLFNSL
jgi:hypothetical protein